MLAPFQKPSGGSSEICVGRSARSGDRRARLAYMAANLPNKPECKALVQHMMDAGRRSGEIVSSWNDICDVLRENRMGRYQILPPDDIWISKKNRTRGLQLCGRASHRKDALHR